ncbi:MAG: AraC family transcriptional regulator [Treponema sp.]|nr:AraC family transcriptional regulator [Spirochaetia bacterium]MDD7460148.1 AraC family transcriptional regulator [Spirochaetales bacterium]MDY5810911.1 AraC family transcriptional regulator [Treponema sp.]MEE1181543.1 AraC family transcriptional regulator [Treponema sp.]
MAVWRPKKILFIGTHSALLKVLSKENETEVISSINFIGSLTMSFVPDLIVAETLNAEEIITIRKTDKLAFVPILISSEKITEEECRSAIPFSNVILCSATVCTDSLFIEHLKAVLTKTKKLAHAKTSSIVKRAILFVDSNLAVKFTRKDICSQINTNEDYLTRVFRKEMGMGLWDYINILRLEEAKSLLTYTGLTIKEVAQRCGFTTSAYLCNCFKRRFNISPDSIRQG